MKQIIKNIFLVSYIKNKGIRRLCFVIGLLFAALPFLIMLDSIHIKRDYESLSETLGYYVPEKTKLFVFEKYKYECDSCKTKDDFSLWKETFSEISNRKLSCNDFAEENKEKCEKIKNYIYQPVHVDYYDLSYLSLLKYVIILLYTPFVFVCILKWIVSGFKQSKKTKKNLLLLLVLCFVPTLCKALPPKNILTVDDLMIYYNHQEKGIQALAIYYTEGVKLSFADELTYEEKLKDGEEEKRRKLAYCTLLEPSITTLKRIAIHHLDGDIKGDEKATMAIKNSLLEYCSKRVGRGDFDKEYSELMAETQKENSNKKK